VGAPAAALVVAVAAAAVVGAGKDTAAVFGKAQLSSFKSYLIVTLL
jgi:hypothetical protein